MMQAKFDGKWIHWDQMTEAQREIAMQRYFAILPPESKAEAEANYRGFQKLCAEFAKVEDAMS